MAGTVASSHHWRNVVGVLLFGVRITALSSPASLASAISSMPRAIASDMPSPVIRSRKSGPGTCRNVTGRPSTSLRVRAMSWKDRSSGPSTGTSAVPAHDRSRSRPAATGEVLLREARIVLDAVTAAARRTQHAGRERPSLRVALKADYDAGLLPRILRAYEMEAVALPVDLQLGGRGDQVAALVEGRADVAILPTPFDDHGLDTEPMLTETRLVACRPTTRSPPGRRCAWPTSPAGSFPTGAQPSGTARRPGPPPPGRHHGVWT